MPIESNEKIFLTKTELKPIFAGRGVVDGTRGGLLLGNQHSDGGVKVIKKTYIDDLFEIIVELEGWEFIINPLATQKEIDYLKKINSEFAGTTNAFERYDIPHSVGIIDSSPILKNVMATNKLILFGEFSQFVVNKHSTKKYVLELDAINKKYPWEL